MYSRVRFMLAVFGLVLTAQATAAHHALLPLADGQPKSALEAIARTKLPVLDMPKVAAEDATADHKGAPGGFRYAVPHALTVVAMQQGDWLRAADGRGVWRWRVSSVDALHLNFGFREVFLPEGAQLRIVAVDGSVELGPYTSADNTRDRELWTAPIYSNDVVIELAVSDGLRAATGLSLVHAGSGYRGFGLKSAHCKSGACNMDVACLGSSDPWNQPRRAVASYSQGGSRLCTGSLLNNTRGDRRMLFATATHCEIDASNAASLVVFWNFDAPSCRTPGSAASGSSAVLGPTNQTQSGASLLAQTNNPFSGASAAGTRSDFTLLELTAPANPAYSLYWSGWDRRAQAPVCSPAALCASIHHPDGNEKRITFSEANPVLGAISSASGVHWDVAWDPTPPALPNIPLPIPNPIPPGVTEPGSSGAPFYNAQQRLVGVLSGGLSICGATGANLSDDFGQLSHAWEGLGTSSTRMRDYLDPLGSGTQAIDGVSACPAPTIGFNAPTTIAAGSAATLVATAAGLGPFTVEFDVDGDGVFDSSSANVASNAQAQASFPTRGGVNVSVRVTDRTGCSGRAQRAVVVLSQDLVVSSQAATQLCGNNNSEIDPGEQWRVPITLTNNGELATNEGVAIFTRAAGSITGVPSDSFGYRVLDSSSASCPYNFAPINIAGDPALPVTASDDGRATSALDLGVAGVSIYGKTVRRVAMWTNGYLSTNESDDLIDFNNACGLAPSDGGRLNALHDDLVIQPGGGLRRRYFSNCPRASDVTAGTGCTVFQWTNMGLYVQGQTAQGSAEFQAVVYDNGQIVYQYATPDPLSGGAATISVQDGVGAVNLEYGCNQSGRAPAGRAVCFFPPTALPAALAAPKLALESSRVLATLAPGQSVPSVVSFSVDPAAVCGAPLAIRYVGSVDRVSSSMRGTTILDRRIGGGGPCQAVPLCYPDATPFPLPARADGLFTNLSRLGNGINAFTLPNGNQWGFGATWFTAARDHRPEWLTVQGEFGDRRLNAQAELEVLRFRQTSASPFRVESSVAGSAQVTYITPTDLVLTWNVDGSVGGERMILAYGQPRPSGQRTGAWFNPGEGGWGTTIDDHFLSGAPDHVIVVYFYDADGRPTWTLGGSANLNGGSMEQRVFQVHCPTCPALIGGPSFPAGNLVYSYSSQTQGIHTININLPAPLSGSWTRSNLPVRMLTAPLP